MIAFIVDAGGSETVATVIREAAFELDISPETAKRYLMKHSARRGTFAIRDRQVVLRNGRGKQDPGLQAPDPPAQDPPPDPPAQDPGPAEQTDPAQAPGTSRAGRTTHNTRRPSVKLPLLMLDDSTLQAPGGFNLIKNLELTF